MDQSRREKRITPLYAYERFSGVIKGERREGDSLPPGAAGDGGAKQPHQKYNTTNKHKSEYDKVCRMSQK